MNERREAMYGLRRIGAVIFGMIDPTATEYRGVVMRSALEADFARHLDAIEASWEYESRTFGTYPHGYLPDFATNGTYIEVKPTKAEVDAAKEKMSVIWDEIPDAVLLLACAEGSTFYAAVKGSPWTEWVELWKHV